MKPRWTVTSGRELQRDGVPVFDLSRVNLGHCRYATGPAEADAIARTIANALNAWESPELDS